MDLRFVRDAGEEIFAGHELLLKGLLEVEGGVHLITGYPRGMMGAFFNAVEGLKPLLAERGMVVELGGNESQAAGIALGGRMAGGRSVLALSGMGLLSAGEALAMGARGRAGQGSEVVLLGEDPGGRALGSHTDTGLVARQMGMPVLEPACSQEIKDWVGVAFALGAAGGVTMGLRVRPWLLGGGGSVSCGPNHFPEASGVRERSVASRGDLEKRVAGWIVASGRGEGESAGWLEADSRARQELLEEARKWAVNRVWYLPQKGEIAPLGLVVAGAAYGGVQDALGELQLKGKLPICRLGLIEPVDEELVLELARVCRRVAVIEESTSWVERQVWQAVERLRQGTGLDVGVVAGKTGPNRSESSESPAGLGTGLEKAHPSMLLVRLGELVREFGPALSETARARIEGEIAGTLSSGAAIAGFDGQDDQGEASLSGGNPGVTSGGGEGDLQRTPTFCAGCPQRDSASVLVELRRDLGNAEYMLSRHKRRPVELVVHGDAGCATLWRFEPNSSLVQSYWGMGVGPAAAVGLGRLTEYKQVVVMGQGTFGHSGQAAIGQSIQAGDDVTYLIVDNKTAALGGELVRVEVKGAGGQAEKKAKWSGARQIERAIAAMIPRKVGRPVSLVRIDPGDRHRCRALLEESILSEGVKVVVADKECAITRLKGHGRGGPTRRQLGNWLSLPWLGGRHRGAGVASAEGSREEEVYVNVAEEVCEYCLECTRKTGCPGLTVVETDYGPKIQTDFASCVNDGACRRINACPAIEEVVVRRGKAAKGKRKRGYEGLDLAQVAPAVAAVHGGQESWRCHIAGVGGMGVGVLTAVLAEAGRVMGYRVGYVRDNGRAVRSDRAFSQLIFSRSQEKAAEPVDTGRKEEGWCTTAAVPFGKADLLMGLDLIESARAVATGGGHRVAGKTRTAVAANTALVPTMQMLLGKQHADVTSLREGIGLAAKGGQYACGDASELSARLFGSKHYVNMILLGMAFQRGWVPVTIEAIEEGIRKTLPGDAERNQAAFVLGRKWSGGSFGDGARLNGLRGRESAKGALRRKLVLMRGGWRGKLPSWWGGRRRAVRKFSVLMRQFERAAREAGMGDELLRDVVIRAYDCWVWGGMRYAQRYCERLMKVLSFEQAGHGQAASAGGDALRATDGSGDVPRGGLLTRTVAWNLAKLMLIKDEVYVAAMLGSLEKKRQDQKRFGVERKRGDRLRYQRVLYPQLRLYHWVFHLPAMHARSWHLVFLRAFGSLARLMFWHRAEVEFRRWYEGLLEQVKVESQSDYEFWTAVLSVPAGVTGFRDVRLPKMAAARRQVEELLASRH
ncbi:MAG: 2-oxoacid:acceptor oxidoreductase family protein [Phycisphaeraceae bacterium]|nr:2-oxoacid:acceptor oxidoreductase family protein [Phycisphaeraceae bacterium]